MNGNLDKGQKDDSQVKFQNPLLKLFQSGCADLDFGIYRILNYKRKQVEEFIADRLPQIVDEAFQAYAESDMKSLQREIESARQEILRKLGKRAFDQQDQLQEEFRDTPLGREYLALQERKAQYQVTEDLKIRVYNDLYTFFSRYYEDGDFIAKRRYGRHETYAIPYNGEEVVLHWATKDQYYIKTGERFKNYRFTVQNYTVSFELRNAATEQNNNKGEKRYFVLASDNPVVPDPKTKTLTVFFEYRPLTDAEQKDYGRTEQQKLQDKLNEEAAHAILEQVQDPTLKALLANAEAVNGQSLLMKHLTRFTRRNTSDFFIHKDLRGFLRRELDFFIKSECLLLDELLAQEGNLTHQHILRARVVRDIGHKIIDFLAQVEDFQKRLFEKKKFVIRTEYCITIDRVPEALWDEVLQNEAQLAEWQELYGVNPQPTKEFLRQHPTLVVDTRHFSEDFKWRLLAHFDDLDEALDGVLIKSENFQALNLLLEKYRGKVKCIYIDPPYNTGSDEFLYKDRYQHSSWLSMMADRLTLVREWLREDGAIFVSCDDHEVHHLRKIGDSLWQAIGTFVWEKKKKGSHLSPTFRDLTEYILAYTPDLSKIGKLFGEKAYSGEWQRLINRANAEGELLFPARKVHAELDDGTHPAGTYGNGEMAVHLLDDISVQDGIVQNQFRMRARFKWKQETLDKELERGSIVKLSKNMRPNVLRADQEEKTKRPPSLITKDIAAYEDAFAELNNLFGEVRYPYPKPVGLVRFFINAMTYFNPQGIVLDFFAGSGTTAHAVINLNREDSGKRKYILVEMGDWFETVMLPRIKKVVFCEKWKDGKLNGGNGVSHFLKYLSLEQYEDTLNNLELPREQEGQLALEQFGDEYLLRYMLDFETQGSPCLLNLEQFQDPFAYKLKVQEGDEIRERVVDLMETFNYLLGIHVKKMRQFQDNGRLYRAVLGEKDGKRIVIVWRPLKGLNGNKTALRRDQQFIEGTALPALLGEGKKPDRLLVNGICYVPDAEPIEPEFKRLMWKEGQDGQEA
jgi:adenine-specific DNA-methyltransferase